MVLAWVSFNLYVPMDSVDPRYLALVTVLPQMATIAVAFLALRRPQAVAETVTEITPAAA